MIACYSIINKVMNLNDLTQSNEATNELEQRESKILESLDYNVLYSDLFNVLDVVVAQIVLGY